MKSKKRATRPARSQKKILFIVLASVVVFIIFFLITLFAFKKSTMLHISTEDSSRNSLQLETFYPTIQLRNPTPTSAPQVTRVVPTTSSVGGICPHDMGIKLPGPHMCACPAYEVDCENHHCAQLIPDVDLFRYGTDCSQWGWCDPGHTPQGDGWYCMGKPVIYLYPEKDTLVGIIVKTEGKVVVSDPKIEMGNSWTNVLAHPGGMLSYQGKSYSELFYETESSTLSAPKKGIVIKTSELASQLRKNISLLGLTKENEQQEFLDWWVPRLQALHAPYILFSILDQNEKNRVDNVEISPKPDTFTDFMAYFKPLSKIEDVLPLEITPAPKRNGFTAIEWGGIIDEK